MTPRTLSCQIIAVLSLTSVPATILGLMFWGTAVPPFLTAAAIATTAAFTVSTLWSVALATPLDEPEDDYTRRKRLEDDETRNAKALAMGGKAWLIVFVAIFGSVEIHGALIAFDRYRGERLCVEAMVRDRVAAKPLIGRAVICRRPSESAGFKRD